MAGPTSDSCRTGRSPHPNSRHLAQSAGRTAQPARGVPPRAGQVSATTAQAAAGLRTGSRSTTRAPDPFPTPKIKWCGVSLTSRSGVG
jgi:hypothetical protein